MSNPAAQCAQAQTVANALSGEKAFETVRFAITGDTCADLMSAMRACADRSGLSARQVQLIFECYAALYKESADQHDRDWRDWQQKQRMGDPEQPCAPPGSYTPASGSIDPREEGRRSSKEADHLRGLKTMVWGKDLKPYGSE